MVQISNERFLELLKAEDKLDALEACGVDNWSGYEEHTQYKATNEELQTIVQRFSV
ncbi:TPA: hypothetical protein PTV43_003480 [Clostridium botulinum]|uniref:hypothetical protein n=1 Tax=Clostridium botulinum TaxID=1491 RepID=UPI001473CC36|nr:hypothetical protein [Clostridium botulinum]MDU4545310.1 hypothetical protein [Clostridium botulinum]HDK7158284.1 hypothetical protein [Clostridium botulinum]